MRHFFFVIKMCWVDRKIPAIFFSDLDMLYVQPSPHQVLLGGYLVTPEPYVDGIGSYGGICNTHPPFFYYNEYPIKLVLLLLHPVINIIIKLITLRGVPNARCYSFPFPCIDMGRLVKWATKASLAPYDSQRATPLFRWFCLRIDRMPDVLNK